MMAVTIPPNVCAIAALRGGLALLHPDRLGEEIVGDVGDFAKTHTLNASSCGRRPVFATDVLAA